MISRARGLLVDLLLVVALLEEVSSATIPISVDPDKPLFVTDANFLSVALDSSLIAERWRHFDFESDAVISMARALSPAYLRIGGTAADLLVFDENGKRKQSPFWKRMMRMEEGDQHFASRSCSSLDLGPCSLSAGKPRQRFFMSGEDWRKMNEFARKAGWKLLFDINVLKRTKKVWSKKNARSLLKFSSKLGYDDIAFELGNEPNSLHHQLNYTLPGFSLGNDFARLRSLLNSFPVYTNSTLVGPDINHVGTDCNADNEMKKQCKAFRYLSDVIKTSRGVIDAVTWHQYYLNGHVAVLKDFLNTQVYDDLHTTTQTASKFLWKTLGYAKPLWLGETSSAYGGGAPQLSNRFVSGFLWLNKLGTAASNGHSVVIRQSFFHGHYALLDNDLHPNPDFWVSAIYKHLVGTKVLRLRGHENRANPVRLFAHCAADSQPAGSIVAYAINLSEQLFSVKLDSPLSKSSIQGYVLSPEGGNLTTRTTILNGIPLKLLNGNSVPDFKPVLLPKRASIDIPGQTMSFWVFSYVNLSVCK